MKIVIYLLVIVSLLNCTKTETIVLERSIDNYDYFPNELLTYQRKFVSVDDSDTYFWLSGVNNSNSPNNYNFGVLDFSDFKDSCHFAHVDNSYHEEVYHLIKSENNISFEITENHSFLHSSSIYPSPMEILPYRLNLIKEGLRLGDEWVESKDLIFEYYNYYNTFDTLAAVFNYEVTGFDEKLVFNNKEFLAVIIVKVNYSFGNSFSYSKSYGFADNAGLVYIKHGGYEFYLDEIY